MMSSPSFTFSPFVNNSNALVFGLQTTVEKGKFQYQFNGAMDDISIYNQTLTENYISNLYHTEISGLLPKKPDQFKNQSNKGNISSRVPLLFTSIINYLVTGSLYVIFFSIMTLSVIVILVYRNYRKKYRKNAGFSFKKYIAIFIGGIYKKNMITPLSNSTLQKLEEMIEENMPKLNYHRLE